MSFGMALLFSPASTLRFFWSDDDATQRIASELGRALGIREVVLGLGIMGSVMRNDSLTSWLLASAAVDTADVTLTLTRSFSFLRRGQLVMAVAGPLTIPLEIYLAFNSDE